LQLAPFIYYLPNYFFSLQVEKEVERLRELKSIKMKELLLKKKLELEEICRKTHLTTQTVFPGQNSLELLDYGKIFPKFFEVAVNYIILHLLHNDSTVCALLI